MHDSEWAIDRLNVGAYLERIEYRGETAPDGETLQALHRAHVESIPFENLDILLGRGISLELETIQEKMIHSQRGGYCFEHDLLFGALLERLGFTVTRLAARVDPGRPGPRTHMNLLVEAGGERWLADVGFGTGLLEAVRLSDGSVSRQSRWTYGLALQEDSSWLLRSLAGGEWSDEYAFTLDPQLPIDYVVHNHFTSTHPRSPFVNQLVALRKTSEGQYTLRGRQLVVSEHSQTPERREIADDDLANILEWVFGIVIDSDRLRSIGSGGVRGNQ